MKRAFWIWLATLIGWIILIAFAPTLLPAQTDNTIYVRNFAGATVGQKVTNAMITCGPNLNVPCILVLDPSLAAFQTGTMPTLCSHCYLWDFRKGPSVASPLFIDDLITAKTPGTDIRAFGAKCDGTTDDSAAMSTAMTAAATLGVNGGVVIFPPHMVCVGHLNINTTGNAGDGQHGVLLWGYGSTLKGRSTDSTIIQVMHAAPGSDPAPGADFANGISIYGLTLDLTAMPSAASTCGIAIRQSYQGRIQDVTTIGETALDCGVYLGNEVYTYQINHVAASRIWLNGHLAADPSTTITLIDDALGQLQATNIFRLTVEGGAFQGNMNFFSWTNISDAIVMGIDLEQGGSSCTSSGGCIYYFGAGVTGVLSYANDTTGTPRSQYINSNTACLGCELKDRPVLGKASATQGNPAFYSRTIGDGIISNISSTPVTIHQFLDVSASQGYGVVIVSGGDGTNEFYDLLYCGNANMQVISTNQAGLPAARTYTFDGNTIQMSIASGSVSTAIVALEGVGQ